MTRRHRSRQRIELSDWHLLQLHCGFDFLGNAFGHEGHGPIDIAAMRQAWQDAEVRQQVKKLRQYRERPVQFAAIAFGDDGRGGTVQSEEGYGAALLEYSRRSDEYRRQEIGA